MFKEDFVSRFFSSTKYPSMNIMAKFQEVFFQKVIDGELIFVESKY